MRSHLFPFFFKFPTHCGGVQTQNEQWNELCHWSNNYGPVCNVTLQYNKLTKPTSCQWWYLRWRLSVFAHSQTSYLGCQAGCKNKTKRKVRHCGMKQIVRDIFKQCISSILPVLMEIKWNICELWIVVKQDLLQIRIANYFLPSILIH